MRRESGGEVYLNRWPQRLDLEELVYRPALNALAFLGAFCARAAASVGDVIVFLGERILFTKAPGIFVPKHDENFGAYERKPRRFLVGRPSPSTCCWREGIGRHAAVYSAGLGGAKGH